MSMRLAPAPKVADEGVTDDDRLAVVTNHRHTKNIGTYSASSGGSGNVDGVVSGNTIYFALNQTTAGCVGSFSGTATVNGGTLNFTFTGSDCLGNHNNGRGNATRQ